MLQGPPRLSQLEAPRFAQSSQRKSTRKLAKRAAGVGCGPPPTKTAPSDAHSASLADGARVIVVGGGIGGLATAGRLARAGFDVTVLEKNAEASRRNASRHMRSVPQAALSSGPFKRPFQAALSSASDAPRRSSSWMRRSPSQRRYAWPAGGRAGTIRDGGGRPL